MDFLVTKAPNFCNVGHRATDGSGHRMPSTHPSRAQLVRHWVNSSSTLLSGASLSHSSGVSSTKVDWVVPSSEADSLPPRGVASPLGVATKKSQLQWMTLTFLPSSRMWYVICNLTYNHLLCLAPPILHLSLALECVQLHKDYVAWHELHSTCCSVIVPFLLVCFAVGLQACFSIGLFEVLPHFFNISWDMARAHMGTHCQKVEIDWETWASLNHQIMW